MATRQVFHHVPRPISVSEFKEAVEAVCRPRFPTARFARPRRIFIAVSGGVDSMALAYLTGSLVDVYGHLKVADNPADRPVAVVVDHKMREGSTREAAAVAMELRKMRVRPLIRTLNWKHERRHGFDPESSNVESRARTLRYQSIGIACRYLGMTSLFFAHHRDDQYETVLMRLLGGHGYRGLQGIREANDIPECYDMYGAYKSGLLDDQMAVNPSLSFAPLGREMRQLRHSLRREIRGEPVASGLARPSTPHFPGQIARDLNPDVPYLTPLNSEDGGVTVYRPLLEFDKDRLIATCEANNIAWFEDPTNADPTLTTRNALRHIVANHELPRALQKPAILDLSRKARRKADAEEAEATRLLQREAVIRDFDPNVGTLLVELPTTFGPGQVAYRRLYADARQAARIPHRRLIAAIMVRKLLDYVTPEQHLPSLANLDHVVYRLFPELFPEREPTQPKAFSISGVIFDPVTGLASTKWFLSRAPYPSTQQAPTLTLPGNLLHRFPVEHFKREPGHRHSLWRSWAAPKLWDGRFWIRASSCVPARLHILPFRPELSKTFRRTLPPKQRTRLERILKYYAPGKVRSSLPALYRVEADPDRAWGQAANHTFTLLALPSLGIHVPGLERWVKYEVRFKRVDVSLLGLTKRGNATPLMGYRRSSTASRLRRRARLAGGRRRLVRHV